MGIIEDIVQAGKSIVSAAQGAVNKVVQGVKDTANKVIKVIKPYIPTEIKKLARETSDTLDRGREILANTEAEVLNANSKLIAAAREHDNKVRQELTELAAKNQAVAAANQVKVAAKLNELKDTAAKIAEESRRQVKAVQDDAKSKQATYRAEVSANPTPGNFFRAYVNDWVAGDPLTVQEYHPTAEAIMKSVTDLASVKVKVEGREVPIVLGLPGVTKIQEAVGKEAAEEVAEKIMIKGAEEASETVLKNPKNMLNVLTAAGKQLAGSILGTLIITSAGESALTGFGESQIKSAAGGLAAAERSSWISSLGRLTPKLKSLLGVAIFLWGAEYAVGWLRKEAVEVLGIAAEDALRSGDYKEALRMGKDYLHFIEVVENEPLQVVINNFPLIGPYFKSNIDAQRAVAESVIRRAEEGLAKYGIKSSKLQISVSPQEASVYINGKFQGKGPYFETNIAPGTYTVTADASDFEAQSSQVTLKEEETIRVEFTLTPSISKVFKTWEKQPAAVKSDVTSRFNTQYTKYIQTPAAKKQDFYRELENVGTLTLISSPQSDVYIVGGDAGLMTPIDLTLTPGSYDVTFSTPGYNTETKTAIVRAGQRTVLSVNLTPRALTDIEVQKAYCSITTIPLGAYVWIDNILANYPSPVKVDLSPGSHKIKISKAGFEDIEDVISLSAGETKALEYELQEAAAEKVYRVNVTSDPSGAKILVDSFFTGAWTPGYVDLLPGTYDVSVIKSGYLPASQIITLAAPSSPTPSLYGG